MIEVYRQLTTRQLLARGFPVILDAALDEKLYELLYNPALPPSGSLSHPVCFCVGLPRKQWAAGKAQDRGSLAPPAPVECEAGAHAKLYVST